MIKTKQAIKSFLYHNNIDYKIKCILENKFNFEKMYLIEDMIALITVKAKVIEEKAIMIACYIIRHRKDFI
jgi:hypothetical protein